VFETDSDIRIVIALPGVSAERIVLRVDPAQLVVQTERASRAGLESMRIRRIGRDHERVARCARGDEHPWAAAFRERARHAHQRVRRCNRPRVDACRWRHPIESSRVPGSGKLILTGQLGEGMKESAQTAVTLVKAQAARKLQFAWAERVDEVLATARGEQSESTCSRARASTAGSDEGSRRAH
jgi:hypothetical protein